jgi:hypothetical protein
MAERQEGSWSGWEMSLSVRSAISRLCIILIQYPAYVQRPELILLCPLHPDSATLILYGLVSQDSSSLPSPSTSSTQTLTLHIGKYTPNPPPITFSTSFTETNTSSSTAAASATSSRPPRPDDPLPRQPPASGKDWFKELAGGGGSAREKKRRREESTSAGRGEKKRRDEREKEEEERNVFGSRGGGDSRGSDEARMKENRPYAEGGEGSHPSSEQGGGGSRRPSITINNETDPSATNIVESPSELPDTSAATTITSAPAPPFSTRKKPPVPKPNQLEAENKAVCLPSSALFTSPLLPSPRVVFFPSQAHCCLPFSLFPLVCLFTGLRVFSVSRPSKRPSCNASANVA